MSERDRAVGYFRKFALICPDAERISYFSLFDRLRGTCRTEAAALRLLAVFDTLRFLEATGQAETAEAVRAVYMIGGGKAPGRNEISRRVRRFALSHNMDDRTVWRRLSDAKALYNSLIFSCGGKAK